MIIHLAETPYKITISLPNTLKNLKAYGHCSNAVLENIPCHLQSLKHTNYEKSYLFDDIIMESLHNKTLKVIKANVHNYCLLECYLFNSDSNLEEIHLPLPCDIDEKIMSLILPNQNLRKISFFHSFYYNSLDSISDEIDLSGFIY